jgi:iron complex outermembrane receptor protein
LTHATTAVSAEEAKRMEALLGRLESDLERVEKAEARPPPPAPAPQSSTSDLASTSGANAETREELSAEGKGQAYEEVVVTASRHAENAIDAPVATTTITSEEIALSGATSLPDLFRRVPGMDVMVLGVGSADVSIRGFNQRVANKVLVLVDGRSVYEDFLGFTLFDEIPIELEEIERIEIIRGPGSALYGANAFMGVINIITKRAGVGPSMQAVGGGGSGPYGLAHYLATQSVGRFAYRVSAGYDQSNKYSVDYPANEPDVAPQVSDPNLGLRTMKANAVLTYQLTPGSELSISSGVNKIFTEIYPLGLLRNYYLDGLHLYTKADATAGPVKLRVFWNHLQADAGPQYWPLGVPTTLATTIVTNVLDGDAQLDQAFHLGGEHHLNLGVGYRLKTAQWTYLAENPVENHFSAFAQDEYKPISLLAISASIRADRHPLLDDGKPGFAISPRGAVVFTPAEGHALRFSAGTAFREPTFVESYTRIETPVPGQSNLAVLTEGNEMLKPERVFALELGYRGEVGILEWDLALYRNQVNDLIVLSPVTSLPISQSYDPVSHEYLYGLSQFQNDPPVYTALGAEVGLKVSPLDGLGFRGSFAAERITASDIPADLAASFQCVPCADVPEIKAYVGASYRTPFRVDLNADASWVSSTTWIERQPAEEDPSQVAFVGNPLGAYEVVNARVAYHILDNHLEVAVVGTNLGQPHQEHPFGNLIDSRVMVTLGGQL